MRLAYRSYKAHTRCVQRFAVRRLLLFMRLFRVFIHFIECIVHISWYCVSSRATLGNRSWESFALSLRIDHSARHQHSADWGQWHNVAFPKRSNSRIYRCIFLSIFYIFFFLLPFWWEYSLCVHFTCIYRVYFYICISMHLYGASSLFFCLPFFP